MNDAERWIADYLRRDGDAGDVDLGPLLDVNFVERGLLDSLALVALIADLEDRFDVRLDAEQMQDPAFMTIRGMAAAVGRSRAAA
ncbi:MAG TPA: acyl carrier protein [Solirubrobacteraceae bacterium]|jgi:acyl carrier protein|nr:acyl carrier protein [Solirubrobacteraceae bacterium]